MKNAVWIIWFGFLISASTQRAMALPLSFDFSFLDAVTGKTVTGVISGLTDNSTSAASSVLVSSNSGGYGLGEYVGSPFDNAWTVSGGMITYARFLSIGNANVLPSVTCCTLGFDTIDFLSYQMFAGINDEPDFIPGFFVLSPVTFTPHSTEVYLPASLSLLVMGLFALGFSRRQRQLPN